MSTFEHAGATLVVEEHGAGPRSIVLLHGIGMGRTVFGDLVAILRDDYRTLAIDLPGYGAAPEPPRTPTIERTADLVAALLRERALGDVTLVGHSMGSQVAAEVAVRHPSLVDRLVLAAPTVNADERSAARQILRLAQDLAIESPRVVARGAREYLRAGPNLRRKMRAILLHRPELAYPRVAAPTLVLRGALDYVSPQAWCEAVASLLPDGRLVEIEGHGHETMIRDAAPAAAAIREFVEST
ncbi:alpha/beta hydrolase [Microbacterium ulmi]|uniref:Alpha/beta hydrolase n=1 Tax=Microbacterium ulmi TaxID=179095 RepID=A0A7Y2M2K5_9MICO|nr:alpha/beta hydrolase [Microbacterium ulmi]